MNLGVDPRTLMLATFGTVVHTTLPATFKSSSFELVSEEGLYYPGLRYLGGTTNKFTLPVEHDFIMLKVDNF